MLKKDQIKFKFIVIKALFILGNEKDGLIFDAMDAWRMTSFGCLHYGYRKDAHKISYYAPIHEMSIAYSSCSSLHYNICKLPYL